ncbi:MAG: murein biosynthesis integral membrane protein MurJ [Candidatus Geothermincolales bacterium]
MLEEGENRSPRDDPETAARHAAIMAVGTLLSRVTGFLRYASLAYVLGLTLQYGRTNLPSTYNLANTLPNMIFDLVMGGIIGSLFIPVFVEYLSTRSEDEAWHVASSVINISAVVLFLVTVIGIVIAPHIIRLMTVFGTYTTHEVSAEAVRAEASFFLRFFLPQIIFYGLSAIFGGLLNSYRHFTVPAFAPIANNIVVILTVIVFRLIPGARDDRLHMTVLAIGTTLGVMAQALAHLPALIRRGIRYRPVLDVKHPAIRKIGRLSIPLLGYIFLWQLGTWFLFSLAIRVDGGVPSYQYAQLFFMLPYGVFAVSVITAIFPSMSERAAKRHTEEFREIVNGGLRSTMVAIFPFFVLYSILSVPIIRLLLEHGFFKSGDTELLAGVLFFFSLALVPYSLDMLVTKAFYAMQDTKTPMINNCFVVAVNMVSNYLFFRLLGVKGLALGFSVTYLFAMILDGAVLRLRIGGLGGKKLAKTFLNAALASLAMAGSTLVTLKAVETLLSGGLLRDFLALAAPASVGLACYTGVGIVLGMDELRLLGKMLSRFLPARPAGQAAQSGSDEP